MKIIDENLPFGFALEILKHWTKVFNMEVEMCLPQGEWRVRYDSKNGLLLCGDTVWLPNMESLMRNDWCIVEKGVK